MKSFYILLLFSGITYGMDEEALLQQAALDLGKSSNEIVLLQEVSDDDILHITRDSDDTYCTTARYSDGKRVREVGFYNRPAGKWLKVGFYDRYDARLKDGDRICAHKVVTTVNIEGANLYPQTKVVCTRLRGNTIIPMPKSLYDRLKQIYLGSVDFSS